MHQEQIDHALLCATNDGWFYERFCRVAMHERKGGLPLDGQNGVAKLWASAACSFTPTLYRATEDRLTPREVLAFASALSAYYENHLNEWTHEERIAFCQRQGIA